MAHDLRPTGEAAAKPGVRRRFWDFPITGGPFGPKVGMISLIISTIGGLPLRLAVRQWKPRHALSTVTKMSRKAPGFRIYSLATGM